MASRRRADELIAAGRVRINGAVVRELGVSVREGDIVEVDGATVSLPSTRTYVLLNKPDNVVTTMHDPQGRRTVAEFVAQHPGVVPVGRLDYHTTGALLFTNDGELAHLLTHPRFGVDKTYRAEIAGRLLPNDVEKLMEGLAVDGDRFSGAKVRVVAVRRDRSVVDLTIHEGRNRQVRRMFDALGHRVLSLTRLRFGPLRLGGLLTGQLRAVTEKELAELEQHRRPHNEPPRTKPA